MTTTKTTQTGTPRGRPATITREKITDAGIQMTVPKITLVGIAALLGVSQMALYKHVDGLEGLKKQVAEDIFVRWQFPAAHADSETLQDYLIGFSASLRALVGTHPGLAFYLMRRGAKSTGMIEKIRTHHREVAEAYGMDVKRVRWLISTVAFHCIALADTVYSKAEDELAAEVPPLSPEQEAEIEDDFARGMRALIVGLFVMEKEAR